MPYDKNGCFQDDGEYDRFGQKIVVKMNEHEIAVMVLRGRIPAIKELRARTLLGLREAKDVVDAVYYSLFPKVTCPRCFGSGSVASENDLERDSRIAQEAIRKKTYSPLDMNGI